MSIKSFGVKYFKCIVTVFITVFFMISVYVMSASAYSLTGWHIASKSISYTWGDRLQTPGSVIRNAWSTAATDWYGASRLNFYAHNSSANIVNSWNEVSSTKYGRYYLYTNSSNEVTSFTADINAGNTNINNANVARSTANHEFGHIAGLQDLSSGTAVMNTNRVRGSVYIPQNDDKLGITYIYG